MISLNVFTFVKAQQVKYEKIRISEILSGAEFATNEQKNVPLRFTVDKRIQTSNDRAGYPYTKDEVRGLIELYSKEYGIDSTIPLEIARCESNYNYTSKNANSSASGVFQFITSTWNGTPEGKHGLSPFNADANVRAGIRKISEGGINAWSASKDCWKI